MSFQNGHISEQKEIETETINDSSLKIPTFKELIDAYRIVTEFTRKKLNKPCIMKVQNNILSLTTIVNGTGHNYDELINSITTKELDKWAYDEAEKGKLSKVSIKSYLEGFRAMFAQYLKFEYEKLGYKIDPIKIPPFDGSANRYIRPSDELLQKVKEWYIKLRTDDIEKWMFVTWMLCFAMRTGDVQRLKWSNIIKKNGTDMLFYMPHKTQHSSKRTVSWPITNDIMEGIKDYRQWLVKNKSKLKKYNPENVWVGKATDIQAAINKDMRALGFTGTKACYELRKICIDHVYEKFGSEMASSISGDNIDTILHFYADPGALNKVINVSTLL